MCSRLYRHALKRASKSYDGVKIDICSDNLDLRDGKLFPLRDDFAVYGDARAPVVVQSTPVTPALIGV
jgi:hypothetical protein